MKWEYYVVRFEYGTDSDLAIVLDGYGSEGWELISFRTEVATQKVRETIEFSLTSLMRAWCLFKRPA